MSAKALASVWTHHPGYLLSELGGWIQAAHASDFVRAWPRMVAEVLGGGGGKGRGGGGGRKE